jgi:hypothetical protein
MRRHSHVHSHDWFGGVRCCWTEMAPPIFSVPRQGSNGNETTINCSRALSTVRGCKPECNLTIS